MWANHDTCIPTCLMFTPTSGKVSLLTCIVSIEGSTRTWSYTKLSNRWSTEGKVSAAQMFRTGLTGGVLFVGQSPDESPKIVGYTVFNHMKKQQKLGCLRICLETPNIEWYFDAYVFSFGTNEFTATDILCNSCLYGKMCEGIAIKLLLVNL